MLVMAGYLAAALPPCPGSPARGAAHHPLEAAHAAPAPEGAHAGHGEHAHHGAPVEVAAPAPADDSADSVTAPCRCGCQTPGARSTRSGRLGPALLSAPLACALPRAAGPDPLAPVSPPEAPAGLLDPVPRLA